MGRNHPDTIGKCLRERNLDGSILQGGFENPTIQSGRILTDHRVISNKGCFSLARQDIVASYVSDILIVPMEDRLGLAIIVELLLRRSTTTTRFIQAATPQTG
jgi:hypothetical protein